MAASNSDDSHFDKLVKGIKNRPVIAFVLLLGLGVIALGQLSGALDSIISFTEKRLSQSAPSEQPNDSNSSSPRRTDSSDTAVPTEPTSPPLLPTDPDRVVGHVELIIRSPTQNERIRLRRQEPLEVRGEVSGAPTVRTERIVRSVLLVVRSLNQESRVLASDRSPVTEDMTWRISLRPNIPQSETDVLLMLYLEGSDGKQLASSSRKVTLVKEEQK